jgi:hypothetical protein
MTTTSTWIVLFPKSRVPQREDVLSALSTTRGCSAREVGEYDYDVTFGSHTFSIALNTQAYVRIESREAVESAGSELPNRDEVANFDARFEILFNGDAIGELFTPLLAIADRLAALTGGIGYEADNDAFQ